MTEFVVGHESLIRNLVAAALRQPRTAERVLARDLKEKREKADPDFSLAGDRRDGHHGGCGVRRRPVVVR